MSRKGIPNSTRRVWLPLKDFVVAIIGERAVLRFPATKLSAGPVEATVDVIDLDRLSGQPYKFQSHDAWTVFGSRKYHRGQTIVATNTENGKMTNLARLVTDCPTGLVADHIDGNTLDNRRSNLRVCTVAQNVKNRTKLSRRNKTGVNGVSLRPKGYFCYISIEGVQHWFGPFKTLDEAALKRRELELKHYGEFAPIKQLRRAAA